MVIAMCGSVIYAFHWLHLYPKAMYSGVYFYSTLILFFLDWAFIFIYVVIFCLPLQLLCFPLLKRSFWFLAI